MENLVLSLMYANNKIHYGTPKTFVAFIKASRILEFSHKKYFEKHFLSEKFFIEVYEQDLTIFFLYLESFRNCSVLKQIELHVLLM